MQTTGRTAFRWVSATAPLSCAATALAESIVRLETLDHRVSPPDDYTRKAMPSRIMGVLRQVCGGVSVGRPG